MAVESESLITNWINSLFSRNHRVLLLFVITVLLGILLLWNNNTTDSLPAETRPRTSRNIEQQLKIQLEALPPIPVKVILEQRVQNVTSTKKPDPVIEVKWDYNWDFRNWKDESEMNGVPSRTVYLVRHGQYNFTTGRLNSRGHQQADLTAQRLKALNRPFSRILYSTHARTEETAQHISASFPNIPSTADDILREGGPVEPTPPLAFWKLPARQYFMDGPRLEAAFRRYFYRADKDQKFQSFEIIVAHANIIRFMVLRALQLEKSAWMRLGIPHASITAITINPDSFVLMSMFGEVGHMPVDMVTF